jgi:hypothetical protein
MEINTSKRFFIFTTEKNMQFLKNCSIWLADGTFKSAPHLFKQILVIHGYKNQTSFPLVYCLIPTTETYEKMLLKIKYPDND